MNNNTSFIRKKKLCLDLSLVEGVKFNSDENLIYFHMKSSKIFTFNKMDKESYDKYEKYLIEYFNVVELDDLIEIQ